MQHYRSLADAQINRKSVVSIGVFDGVHLGHQYLVSHLVRHARETGLTPVVLTFYPYPKTVLDGKHKGYYLTTPDKKAELLGKLGVEVVITHPFNDAVRHIRAVDFVDSLVKHLQMRALWIGSDFALGYKREGDAEFLADQGQLKGFELSVVDLMDTGSERVSSSRVREALAQGAVAEAARLMGRYHEVSGVVVEGDRRGRTIGVPTANIDVPEEMAVPERGVYAVFIRHDDALLPAVLNIGLRPTFDGAQRLTVEAHILDFDGDLYGQELTVCFVDRLRSEVKFKGIDELVAQIHKDIETARQILKAGR